jgi:hypothetical protein
VDRKSALLQIRPNIKIEIHSEYSDDEIFQNKVLRPILKFQHELICFIFTKAPSVLKKSFEQKSDDQKRNIIVDTIKSDHKLKSQIVDSITSLMTLEELAQFHANKSEYHKRIISMAAQRLIDGLI